MHAGFFPAIQEARLCTVCHTEQQKFGFTENRPASMLVNMEKAINGTDPSQDLTLLPADIVYVPKSPIANVNLWVDQYIRKNIPIPFGFSYNILP
jgi:hypothetical protein